MLNKIRPQAQPLIDLLAKPFLRINPNLITLFFGIIPSIGFFVFLKNLNLVAALMALVATLFDVVDGAVARKTNKVTAFGGVLDSTMDRLADGLIISAFGFAMLASWELVLGFLVLSYLTSYLRSRAELASEGKIKFDVGILERGERLIGIGIALLLQIIFPDSGILNLSWIQVMFGLLTVLSAITVLQRLYAASQKLH